MDHAPKMSITVRTSNGMEQDVTEYMENSCQPIGFGPDGRQMFPGLYEVDGEDGFVPDLIDEGRDSSSKSSKKRDLFNEDHLIKIYVLSPFLFGKTFQPDSWIKYLYEVGLLATCNPICEDALSMKQLDVVEVIERIHEVVLADSKENSSRKKQMKELFESIDKSVFDRDRGHLKVKPLTEILDRSRKFTFLESWQRTVKEKKDGENGLVLDDRAMFVAVIFTCRQFVEHWHRSNKGESLVDKFKAGAKKKDKQIHKLKEEGNDFFKVGAFEKASSLYSKAIRESPFNAILYGNRAQSCLSCDCFDGALTDGKRAIVLDPGWHKGYLRFAEAYFRLNLKDKAFSVIELGLSFCPNDRNLLDHREKFRDPGKYNNNRISAPNNEDQRSKLSNTAETESSDSLDGSPTDDSESDGDIPDLVSDSEEEDSDSCPPRLVTESENSESEEDVTTVSEKQDIVPEKKMPSLVPKTTKKDKTSRKTEKKHSQPWRRNTRRTDSEPSQESQEKNSALTKMQERDDRHTEVFKLWKQGSESLLDNMFPNAIFFYNKCLDIINKHNIENITRLVELDVILLKFSLGISCVEMGSSKEINEGLRLFNEILSEHTTVKFPLAFHGLGRAWLRQFRFVECLKIVERGLEVVLNMTQQITYTWPGTTKVIKESLSGALQESLEQMVVQCHNPPIPEAVCRYHKCHGYYSNKIYKADPEFKGLVRIRCFAKCTVEYHVECWRRFKKERLSQSDKDYLNSGCLTPDCDGRISKIHIYDQLGATLREIITPVIGKTEIPHKKVPCDKMKLSSVTTIAKREANKQLRKQRKKEVRELELRQQKVGNVGEDKGLVVMSETQQHQHQQQINRVSENAGEEDIGATGLMERLAEAHVYQKLEEAGEVCGQIGMQKYMTVLNKKEEEEEEGRKAMDAKASTKGRSKKKQKSKVTMTLDEFVGPRETTEDGNIPVYMDYMDEFTAESGSLDLENPFARPNKGAIKQELDMFDGLCAETSSMTSSGSHSDNKHSEIKEALFSFFVGILSEHGPLDKDDVIIKRELEDFPVEAHEVIDSAGGIDKLLLQSLQFAVVDNFVCLLPDTVKAKKLADLHKNPLKRSDNPIYASNIKTASRQDFPSLGQASARIPAGAYIRGSKLDELDVFTTTAGNLDSPITSPTGIDSSAQNSWTTNGDSNSALQITNLNVTNSSGVNSTMVTVSKSCVGTIVTAVESPSSKKEARDSLQKVESVGQKSKKTTESSKSSKDKFDIPSKDNSSAKPDTVKLGKGKKDSEVTAASEKKIDVASSGSQKTSRPVKSVTPPATSDKIDNKSSKAKMDTAKPAFGKAKGTTKVAAGSPVTDELVLSLKNKNGIETSIENLGKTTPERQSNIKDSFKKQVHAVAAGKKTGVADVKAKKEEVQPKVETVKKTTTEQAKKVTKKELQVAKGKSLMGGQKGKTAETTKEETVKIQASVDSKGVKDKGHLTLGKFTETKETVKSDSNGISEASSATLQYEQPFVQGTILRSCDDVSPVGSEPFRFPTPHESGTSSQSSMHSLYDPPSLNASTGDLSQKLDKAREIWDKFSVSDPKFQESGGLGKSKLQEWKTSMEEGFGQLDKINNDSEFMTESRTSDKDLSLAKNIDWIGGSCSPPPKFSKPPGFGGKAYSNPAALDNSTNGASRYGPIGRKSRTDSPASGSSKESSHASTPIHGIQADMVDSQLPHFPSVHTGESFISGPSIVTTSLPIEASYHNGLFINNAVWGSIPPPPPSSFNSTLPLPNMAQIGYTNANSPDISVQSTLQQSDEQFINENTNSVYNSLRETEAFKYNPTLKQSIEADIRADIERSKAAHPSAHHKETLAKGRAAVGSKPVKPVVKMRNAACQCTPIKDSVSSVACNTEPYEPYKAEYLKGQVELEVTHTRLNELLDKHTQLQNSSNAELKNLRSRVDALELECKGLRKERSKAVEDRDAENRKWSNEKKLVAEEVKTMKREMKNMKVREENALRQVQEKDSQIATLSSQLNIERETIVSEREKFQNDREELHRLHSMQLSRAENAEVKLLQLKVEVGSQILGRSLKDAEMYAKQSQQIIQNMKEGKKPVPPQLLAAGEQWEATVKSIKDIKLQSMTQFKEQIHQINQGTPLSALQQLPIPRPPRAPENPMAVMNAFVCNNAGGFPGRAASNVPPSGAIPTNRPPNVRMLSNLANQKSVPQGGPAFTGPPPLNPAGNMQRPNNPMASQHKSKSAFDKIMDKLTMLFPNLVRSDISNYIQDLRSSRNGSLSGMSLDDIVRRVAEMILKDNARKPTKPASINQGPPAMASASSSYPSMARISPNPDCASGSTQSDEIFEEEEDPCIICHDELNAAPTEHLKCCHRFHTECIKKWFKEQSTCPTCRVHALLSDDFPSLG